MYYFEILMFRDSIGVYFKAGLKSGVAAAPPPLHTLLSIWPVSSSCTLLEISCWWHWRRYFTPKSFIKFARHTRHWLKRLHYGGNFLSYMYITQAVKKSSRAASLILQLSSLSLFESFKKCAAYTEIWSIYSRQSLGLCIRAKVIVHLHKSP